MTTDRFRSESVPIPTEWTADQAKAVVAFLEEVCLAIWELHHDAIAKAHAERFQPLDDVASPDDEIPF